MSREEFILRGLDLGRLGLEIGPLNSPIAPKAKGYRVETMDHLDREGLIAKYRAQGLPEEALQRIETVDHVWSRHIADAGAGRFGWIIASHVVEHSPDLIGFLNDCTLALEEDGVLSLAVPDRRVTFDCFRPRSSLAQVIDTHIAGAKRPTLGAVIDHMHNAVKRGQDIGWVKEDDRPLAPVHAASETRDAAGIVRAGGYVDVHVWVFSPASFRLMIEDLFVLGFTALRERSFTELGTEFLIQLSRKGAGPGVSRLELAQAGASEDRFPTA